MKKNPLKAESSELGSGDRSPVVVCAADNHYAMQLAVVARSALDHLGADRQLLLYVIDGGITSRNKAKIARSIDSHRCTLTWLNPAQQAIENVPTSGHITAAAYLRLLIPSLLPESIQRAIYLDSDLILNADLGKLWDLDTEAFPLWAVQQFSIPYVSSQQGLMNYRELGIPPNSKYFNSGVLLFNLQWWRSHQIAAQVMDYIAHYREAIRLHDQDALNAVLAGQWGELDPRWNQTPDIYQFATWKESPFSEEMFQILIRDPYLIHFATAGKPWNSRAIHPANDLYFQYVDKTAWAGWRFNHWRRLQNRLNWEIKQMRQRWGGVHLFRTAPASEHERS
jgi:lipopolysaccharide biosynthesis glycosyltransferase